MNFAIQRQKWRMGVIYPSYLILQEKVKKEIEKKNLSNIYLNLLELSVRPDLIHKLVPTHYREKLMQSGIDINNFTAIPLKDLRLSLLD